MILPILITLFFVFVCGGEVQPSKCNACYFKHYEAKGCRPIYENGSDCPVRYNCTNNALDPSVCLVRGKTYKIGEKINHQYECEFDCRCGQYRFKKYPEMLCEIGMCNFHEWVPEKGCYSGFSEEGCCLYKLCPNEAQKKIACDYDGKTYRYGDKIVISKKKSCICNERWSGPDGASCKTAGCLLLDKSGRDFQEGCIPIYYKNECCPIKIICGKDVEVITKSLATNEDIDSGNTCIFKDTHFKRGQKLNYKGKDRDVTCRCDTPPDFTCVMK